MKIRFWKKKETKLGKGEGISEEKEGKDKEENGRGEGKSNKIAVRRKGSVEAAESRGRFHFSIV